VATKSLQTRASNSPEPAIPPRLVCAGCLGLAATAAAVLFAFDPSTSKFYPSCPFHALTGLYCPGCGTCRAIHELLHGHLASAFGLNPLMVLLIPLLSYMFLPYVAFAITGKMVAAVSVPALWARVTLWIILAYWVLRNVPYYPLDLLAP
jgi:hypothetical protein